MQIAQGNKQLARWADIGMNPIPMGKPAEPAIKPISMELYQNIRDYYDRAESYQKLYPDGLVIVTINDLPAVLTVNGAKQYTEK